MELVFTCPHTRNVFHSRHFEVIQNKGVRTDAGGNKTLDARVALTQPCPSCGEKHIYDAGELACPFNP